MPVWYNTRKKKWCVGTRCVYDTKAKAMRSYRAYLSKKKSKKK